jgi:hypothetical protein
VTTQAGGAIRRVTDSPTKLGFGAPSTVIVNLVTACHQPPSSSSKETSSAVALIWLSTGTGAGKRTLLKLYELFGPIPLRSAS